ncbi:MAG: hypothetical protein AAF587_25690 [Bacteroidota bacterium]
MRLLKPFSLLRSKKQEHVSYADHRFWLRFLHVAGVGVQRVAEEHARRIIEANKAIGNQLDRTLQTGFTEIQEHQKEIHHALVDQTQVIAKGFDSVEIRLEKGFDQASKGLNEVADRVDNVGMAVIASSDKLQQGIQGLNASLDMGMMNIVSQFELQRADIQEGFDRLANLMENSRKTEAEERYRDGKQAYEQYLQHPDEPQFLIDALDYLQESIRIYRGNPFAHLYLGHIFQEPAQFYDLSKSLEHYQLCATYAKGIPNPSLAAFGYFMTAWIHYVSGELDEAIRAGELVKKYDPDNLPENYYNLAKFHACKQEQKAALTELDVAIRKFDPLYSVKADMDEDFDLIRDALDVYFEEIREDAAKDWEEKMDDWDTA